MLPLGRTILLTKTLLAGLVLALGALPASGAGGAPAPAPHQESEATRHAQGQAGPHDAAGHRFDDADLWAERFEDPARDAWQLPDSVIAALAIRRDLLVADIGSATGYFPVRFARACPEGRVYGVDVEPEMVFHLNDRARREGLANLVSLLGGADDPHLPVAVDLVFLCNTYHHIDDRPRYFGRLRDGLRPGGRVAVVDYRPDSDRGPSSKLAPDVVEREMAAAGFRLAARHEFLPEQYFLVFSAGE